MVKPATLDILGTLDGRSGVNHSRLLLVRELYEIGLIYELNALWRVLMQRADLHKWIATLMLTRHAPDRSIAVRYSPFLPSDEPEPEPPCERAPDLYAALSALKRD
jgi:hypothetical protein